MTNEATVIHKVEVVNKYTCVSCNKELDEICSDDIDVLLNGGILQLIEIGYGSVHDGLVTVVAMCDDCLGSKCKLSK